MSTHKSRIVRLSEELKEQVEFRSRTDRRSQAETIRIALERFVVDAREPVESSAK